MADRSPREQITVRLNADQLAQARDIAIRETDGNVSLLVRKLVDEALAQRAAKATERAGA